MKIEKGCAQSCIGKIIDRLHSLSSIIYHLSFSVALSLTACSIDAYDKGEGEYSLMTAEMSDVTVGSDKYVTAVETDLGEQLKLTKPVTVKWMEKGDTTYRALVYYNLQSDGRAEAVSMKKVGVLTPHKLKEKVGEQQVIMKTDPLYVESVWVSKNEKYVNMRLRLLTGASEDEEAVQTIGIIRDEESNSHEKLVLYHDQGGQPEYYSTTAFVSIPLAEVIADTLTITVNTYDGSYSKTIVR